MWIVDLCAVFMVLCAACAGVCAGAAIVICREYPEEEDSPEEKAAREVSDEEQREISRRRREMANFFNYSGDVMPKAEGNEMDLKI